jgi:ketosteroid isomerase-like protein
MSAENVEIVRQMYAAFNARERNRVLSMCDPEIELRSAFVPSLAPKTYRGLDEMVRWREDVAAALEDFHFEDLRFLGAGGDRVVALYRIVGRGSGSGVPVSRELGALWQLRDGKLLKGEIYMDQREALEAAGLRE